MLMKQCLGGLILEETTNFHFENENFIRLGQVEKKFTKKFWSVFSCARKLDLFHLPRDFTV